MKLAVAVCIVLLSVSVSLACCDNPYGSTQPPEPTGFRVSYQSATSAVLQWDAVACNSDWLIQLWTAEVYCDELYCWPREVELLITLENNVIAYVDTQSTLPWYKGVPSKVYQLCVVNGHTGEKACAARWVGLQ